MQKNAKKRKKTAKKIKKNRFHDFHMKFPLEFILEIYVCKKTQKN